MESYSASMFLDNNDEVKCKVLENLYGSIAVSIGNITIYCTPKQAKNIAAEIAKGAKLIESERKKAERDRNPQMCKAKPDMTSEELEKALGW